jgi:hypothetical protein
MFDPNVDRHDRDRPDRREPAFPASASSSTRWIAWMPLLFVAAFLYWSVALGLGGLSLMAASAITSGAESPADFAPSAVEPVSGHALLESDSPTLPIVVHLEESAEPEDVNDNVGAASPVDTVDAVDTSDDDGTGRLPGSNN